MEHLAHLLWNRGLPAIIQCVLNTSGFSFLTCVTRTLKWPVIAAAASVHTLVQDFQAISLYKKKQLTMLKMSVVSSRRLQKRMSSRMSSLSTYLAKATSCAYPLISVESSNCNENSPALGYLTTWYLSPSRQFSVKLRHMTAVQSWY